MTAPLAASCFGKLPFAGDFVEPAHRTGFSSDLRNWIHEAANQTVEATAEHESRTSFRLLWPRPDRRIVHVAVLWPSRDALGRPFPFCLYTELPLKGSRPPGPVDLLLQCEPIWHQLQEIAVSESGGSWLDLGPDSRIDVAKVQAAVRAARLAPEDDRGQMGALILESRLQEMSGRRFLTQLLDRPASILFPRLVWRLASVLSSFADAPESCPALRLPATSDVLPSLQAFFWLRLLERLAPETLLARWPALVLPAGGGCRSGLWIVFRDLIPLDGAALLDPEREHPYAVDLRRPLSPDRHLEAFTGFAQSMVAAMTEHSSALGIAHLPAKRLWENAMRA